MAGPVVVKLGGSLMDRAGEICTLLNSVAVPALVVPGGGRFAAEVRASGADGSPGHWMAVAAMEQYAWFISSSGLPATDRLAVPEGPAVLLPYALLRSLDPLPHRWEVTSDTISAWVAHTLGLPLVLLKSVDGIRSGGKLLPRVAAVVTTGDVDPCFLPYVLSHRVATTIVNGRIAERISAAVRGIPSIGTTIVF